MGRVILFKRNIQSSYGRYGEIGGCILKVYSDGTIVYTENLFDEPKSVVYNYTTKNRQVADSIKDLLAEHAEGINQLPTFVDNYVMDGSWDAYQIGKKRIKGCSIRRHAEIDSPLNDQNLIIDIWEAVLEILRKETPDLIEIMEKDR